MLGQPDRCRKFDWRASFHILSMGLLVLFVGALATWLWTPFAAGFARAWITHPICCVLNSLQYAILAMLAWSTRSTPYWFRCGLFVAAAVGVEWLFSLAFPFLWIATNPVQFISETDIAQWACILPTFVFSGILYACFFLLVPRWNKKGVLRFCNSVSGLIILSGLWLIGHWIKDSVPPQSLGFNAMLVQPHSKDLQSDDSGLCNALLERSIAEVRQLPQLDLIVWPEASFQPVIRDTLTRSEPDTTPRTKNCGFLEVADEVADHANFLGGVVLLDRVKTVKYGLSVPEVRKTNCACLVTKVGLIQVHEKLSLVPIRESDSSFLSNPIIQQFLGLPESAKLTPGTNFEVMSFTDSAGKTRKIAVSICYESWQPWLPQYHSNEKLDAICHLVYDGDFADYPVYVDRMLATIRMRAIETRTWQLVCSTWSGSAVIDPRGNIVKRLGPVQGVLRTDSF